MAVILGLTAAGCADDPGLQTASARPEVPAPPAAAVTTAVPPAAPAPASPNSPPLPGPLATAIRPAATSPDPAPPASNRQADYKPPFPDRKDLFVPPKRQGGVRLSDGETEDSVVLLGFVRVNEPLAVLSVNGEVASIAEGAAQYGIEVISIQPPSVVLQRGRQRWQASLEN
ncbi:MAG: hypothetical protein DCC67_01460 [Planctomycetota bacterium]|nr:MAG: hypothetical protein DCC67_01460 [Planctomycetota bacterium]